MSLFYLMYYLLHRPGNAYQSDMTGFNEAPSFPGGTSDDWYGEGWYRFTGKEVQIVCICMLFLVIDAI